MLTRIVTTGAAVVLGLGNVSAKRAEVTLPGVGAGSNKLERTIYFT